MAIGVATFGCDRVIGRPDVIIGTASPADVEYPLGGSICRLFNLDTPHHGLRCVEETSAGAETNLKSLRSSRIDVGIVPSDELADAVAHQGTMPWWQSDTEMRVLFAGHADIFTLVVHRGANIDTFADLRGKRIGIGIPGSRQRNSMDRLMVASHLTRANFAEVRELLPAEQNRAFCDNDLDAIVYSVGHPNGLIRDATQTCHGILVALTGPAVDRMLAQYGEYERAAIPAGTYPVNPEDVHTFGVRAVVVTTARMSDDVAYELTRAVFDNFDVFRRLHPAFETLRVSEMAHKNGHAPLHDGATIYYRERGWIP